MASSEAEAPTASISFRVYGRPAPQGSKRAFAIRKNGVPTGKVAVIESSHDRVKSWRQAVLEAAAVAMPNDLPGQDHLLDGAISIAITFVLPRPKSHYRTGRNAGILRDRAPRHPHGTPDLSKLLRATEDGLTSVVWHDDAQVVKAAISKVYEDYGPSARWGAPGARITISPLA
jgi:Holliday junction resolvase RusA-like endonuclease